MGKTVRVLIVEDSEDDTLMLVHELRRSGFDAAWERVENPTALRQALASESWDLVIADHLIPNFGGMQALAIVRDHDEELPFLFVSGTVGEDVAVAAIKAGASDYILKGQMRRVAPAVERELRETAHRRKRRAAEAEEAEARIDALERSVEERTAVLERANGELEWFAVTAAHELAEPLRMVASYTELLADRLRQRLGEDPETDELLAYTIDGTKRMQELVRDLLASARRRAAAEICVDCDRALAAAIDNLRLAIDETGAVVTHDTLPALAAEETALVAVFQNLIGNALKFRRDGKPEVHVGVRTEPTRWVFAVSDNGVGFARRSRAGDGSAAGVGLALCRRLVESHGGRLWVESGPGAGSTFYFSIPRWPAANRITSFATARS
jgi:signal transduction histidine kinase